MKTRFKLAMMFMVAAFVIIGAAAASATNNNDLPEGASTKTARFYVMNEMDMGGAEFSMLSEDGELVIHIHGDTPVRFEYALWRDFDDEDAGKTDNAREMLYGDQTLAELLDGRKLVVTYAITTRSIPPQTSPISVTILFERAVHPIHTFDEGEIINGNEHVFDLDTDFDYEMGWLAAPLIYISPFEDLNIDAWYFNPVIWAYENGIMNGISDTHFAPEGAMTRAMLVTVLWRYAGEPAAGEAPFADVGDDWYTRAVAWAAANGIVYGIDANTFDPQGYINREQMYTILYRFMNFSGLTIALEDEMRIQQFADADEVSDWALEALHFMFDAGVMFRYSTLDNYARPQANALRGEIATAMYFFDMFSH